MEFFDDIICEIAGECGEVEVFNIAGILAKFIVIVNDENKEIIISIRGTHNLANAWSDTQIKKVYSQKLMSKYHSGFHNAAEIIYHEMMNNLNKNTDYNVSLTGHSYGGAIADILQCMLYIDGYKLGNCVTFGAPKVTNGKGSKKYDNLKYIRIVNMEDPISQLPPGVIFNPYRHRGEEILLLSGFSFCYLGKQKASNLLVNSIWASILEDLDTDSLETGSDYLNELKSDIERRAPNHSIANYYRNIKYKIDNGSMQVKYEDRKKYLN